MLPMANALRAFAMAVLLAGCSPSDAPDTGEAPRPRVETHHAEVDGSTFAFTITGSHGPTVVLDSGIGSGAGAWDAVVPLLASSARVVVFDRPGYAGNSVGAKPRLAERLATELAAALEQLGVAPPYVLAGHSLGAVHVLLFAERFADRTGGIVLLDPPPLGFVTGKRFGSLREMAESQTREWEAAARAAHASGRPEEAVFLETLASEHAALFSETASAYEAVTTLGALPLDVLASQVPNPAFGSDAEEFQSFWIESNRELSRLSAAGTFAVVEGATHQLPSVAPARVAQSIRSVLNRAQLD